MFILRVIFKFTCFVFKSMNNRILWIKAVSLVSSCVVFFNALSSYMAARSFPWVSALVLYRLRDISHLSCDSENLE